MLLADVRRVALSTAFLACCAFARLAHGGAVVVEVQSVRNGIAGVAGAIQPTSVVVSPDGQHVYCANESNNEATLVAFARDGGTGALTFIERAAGQTGVLAGPLVITPDGGHLLLPGPVLSVHARDPLTGQITFVENQMGPGDAGGFSGPRAVAVSPDSAHVYGLARSPGAGLAVYARNATTGALTLVEVQQDGVGGVSGLTGASDVTVSPDGAHVYVAGGAGVVIFARNATTGALTLFVVQGNLPLSNLRISPDGAHAYATDSGYFVTTFLRQLDGSLTHVAGALGGMLGVPPAIDPAGAFVYAPISLYSRDTGSGQVTLEDRLENAIGGIVYIGGAHSVAVSPDGAHFYLAAPLDNALSVFRVRPTMSCSPTPVTPCRTSVPLASILVLKDRTDDDGHRLSWKWKKGGATALEEFDDPPNTVNDYAFCLYDTSGGPQPVLEAVAPAGGLWSLLPDRGYRYRDPRAAPVRDGVRAVDLRAGIEGHAKAVMVARKRYLSMPALPLALPLTAQLQSADGQCWGATYSTTIVHDPTQLRAKSD